MTGRLTLKRPASRNSEVSSRSSSMKSPTISSVDQNELNDLIITDADREPSFWPNKLDERHFGCQHYQAGCKLRAECCDGWFPCRLCHDEASDHLIDRFSIRYMLCMYCQTAQRAGKVCRQCQKVLAHYYCDICHLWDDDERRNIYHCDKCRICRRGLREEYTHCDRCSGCITTKHFPTHKCLEGSLQSNCPICGEDLFSTTSAVVFMPCGHAIHFICHQDHIKISYQCPICLKSLNNMSYLFTRIDELMATQQMPEEYANVRSLILCNDCEQKTTTKFHFVYHRCENCRSYNTKLLGTINEEEGSAVK